MQYMLIHNTTIHVHKTTIHTLHLNRVVVLFKKHFYAKS